VGLAGVLGTLGTLGRVQDPIEVDLGLESLVEAAAGRCGAGGAVIALRSLGMNAELRSHVAVAGVRAIGAGPPEGQSTWQCAWMQCRAQQRT
jgi:hypothetical protein